MNESALELYEGLPMEEALEWLAASRELEGEVIEAQEKYVMDNLEDERLEKLRPAHRAGWRKEGDTGKVVVSSPEQFDQVFGMMKASTAGLYRKRAQREE